MSLSNKPDIWQQPFSNERLSTDRLIFDLLRFFLISWTDGAYAPTLLTDDPFLYDWKSDAIVLLCTTIVSRTLADFLDLGAEHLGHLQDYRLGELNRDAAVIPANNRDASVNPELEMDLYTLISHTLTSDDGTHADVWLLLDDQHPQYFRPGYRMVLGNQGTDGYVPFRLLPALQRETFLCVVLSPQITLLPKLRHVYSIPHLPPSGFVELWNSTYYDAPERGRSGEPTPFYAFRPGVDAAGLKLLELRADEHVGSLSDYRPVTAVAVRLNQAAAARLGDADGADLLRGPVPMGGWEVATDDGTNGDVTEDAANDDDDFSFSEEAASEEQLAKGVAVSAAQVATATQAAVAKEKESDRDKDSDRPSHRSIREYDVIYYYPLSANTVVPQIVYTHMGQDNVRIIRITGDKMTGSLDVSGCSLKEMQELTKLSLLNQVNFSLTSAVSVYELQDYFTAAINRSNLHTEEDKYAKILYGNMLYLDLRSTQRAELKRLLTLARSMVSPHMSLEDALGFLARAVGL